MTILERFYILLSCGIVCVTSSNMLLSHRFPDFSSAGGRWFEPQQKKSNTIKLAFAAPPLSVQHLGVETLTGRLIDKILCPDRMTYF